MPPEADGELDFKQLFKSLAQAGVGKPFSQTGLPPGPWTALDLTAAISDLKENPKGIETRTVQLWFQENNRGISVENIRWLAIIFGCGDPKMVSLVQSKLLKANTELKKKRKRKSSPKNEESSSSASTPKGFAVKEKPLQFNLPRYCEHLISGQPVVNLIIAFFGIYVGLGLLNYSLGTFSVTYSPV